MNIDHVSCICLLALSFGLNFFNYVDANAKIITIDQYF